MLDQGLSDSHRVTLNQREESRWEAVSLSRRQDRPRDECGRARGARMSLDDDWTPGGKRRGCITAGNAEGQRKITRPKHGHRP
jgi:hypothetical protein